MLKSSYVGLIQATYVAVPCRNLILYSVAYFSIASLRSKRRICELLLRAGLKHVLCKCGNYRRNYTSRLSPTLNGSLEIQRFECSDAIEIRDGIMFDFYAGLPHIINSQET